MRGENRVEIKCSFQASPWFLSLDYSKVKMFCIHQANPSDVFVGKHLENKNEQAGEDTKREYFR